MLTPSSNRSSREWLWMIIALLIVIGIIAPVWKLSGSAETQEQFLAKWTPDRLSRLFLGPEQLACYFCFVWASLILLSRYREVHRQRSAFQLDLLPTDEGARILPEDARPLSRKVDATT